ncbi:dienelactone hydrolase family protein [Pseudooceanicola onchidii]|uniref:dienelactone hydrolase family protein n=1 Tax=Pseudooceanicola onchidii TaxID=2562279 RepID=UPI0010AA3D14|nr:dienelactone hydrolase family protein [Pseudooceanicola onchidii]
MLKGQDHRYDAKGAECIGYLALPAGDGPGVLVAPAFGGLSDSDRATCDRLADLGYVALGVDYYSGGRHSTDRAQAAEWMAELQGNRPLFATRMQAALTAIRAVPQMAGKVGAMGYCLGGKGVLDLARSGAAFDAGVTLHGVYDAPPDGSKTMAPALLICDGWDDSLCPPDAKVALAEELTTHCSDWQMLAFGHTGHAFTNVKAAPGKGFGYSKAADRRSWRALTAFFDEILRG